MIDYLLEVSEQYDELKAFAAWMKARVVPELQNNPGFAVGV